jgi:hypothetical protein
MPPDFSLSFHRPREHLLGSPPENPARKTRFASSLLETFHHTGHCDGMSI